VAQILLLGMGLYRQGGTRDSWRWHVQVTNCCHWYEEVPNRLVLAWEELRLSRCFGVWTYKCCGR